MFYFLILILALIFFLIILYFRGNKNHTVLIFLLFSYFVALSSMIVYISKDIYYYNLIKSYFYLPNFIWRWFFFFKVSKINLIRLMNLSSLSIVIISTYFAFSFCHPKKRITEKLLKAAVWLYCIFLAILYDPVTNYKLYYYLYPSYMSVAQYEKMEFSIMEITRVCNNAIVLSCMIFLLIALRNSPKLKLFRFNHCFLCISYGIFSLVYVFFISLAPSFFLKISKIAGTHTYRSIHLSSHSLFYDAFPYFLIAAAALLTYCTYWLATLTNQMALSEFSISKGISSSETTSKIFCHYIKNEILALQSEAELLTPSPEETEILNNIKKRCETLYSRIDEIHRSTKTSELNLKLFSLQEILEQTLKNFSLELSEISVVQNYPKETIWAMVDPVYMEQAIHNIIKNSLDAMNDNSNEQKSLILTLKTNRRYAWIEIKDTGKGISKENLEQIFLPFYSSHPYSKHWGIGLTLTYKIIHAHEGKIDVVSTLGKGTATRIFLPLVTKEGIIQSKSAAHTRKEKQS